MTRDIIGIIDLNKIDSRSEALDLTKIDSQREAGRHIIWLV